MTYIYIGIFIKEWKKVLTEYTPFINFNLLQNVLVQLLKIAICRL